MAFQENHEDCDHVLGNCAVYPGVVIRCPHGGIQASCEACLDDYLRREEELGEGVEVPELELEGPSGQLKAP